MRHAREAGLRGEIHHASDGYFHRDIDRHDVETMNHRIAQRDRLHRVFVTHIPGRILLIVIGESFRLVFVNCRGGDHAWNGIVSSVQRRGVNKRLECRSWLPQGLGAI